MNKKSKPIVILIVIVAFFMLSIGVYVTSPSPVQFDTVTIDEPLELELWMLEPFV